MAQVTAPPIQLHTSVVLQLFPWPGNSTPTNPTKMRGEVIQVIGDNAGGVLGMLNRLLS